MHWEAAVAPLTRPGPADEGHPRGLARSGDPARASRLSDLMAANEAEDAWIGQAYDSTAHAVS